MSNNDFTYTLDSDPPVTVWFSGEIDCGFDWGIAWEINGKRDSIRIPVPDEVRRAMNRAWEKKQKAQRARNTKHRNASATTG